MSTRPDTETVARTPRVAGSLLLLAAVIAFVPAAQGQGTLVGRILDADSGESLIGVNVIIVGSDRGAATDLDGYYDIPNVRAGEYSVKVSYIGYETKLFTAIRVVSGQETTLDIDLSVAVLSTDEEIVIVGERPLLDVEGAASTFAVSADQIAAAPLRDVQEVISNQAGVYSDPTGLYIRGGRAEETGYIVDGVSAKDPLSGTGFGLDIGSNAFREVEVTTGGVGAEFGDVTSGVVNVSTRSGSDEFSGFFSHRRDNFGFNDASSANFKEQLFELNLGGPIIRRKLRFFLSGQVQLSDGFTRLVAVPNPLESSLISSQSLLPRAGNRWNGILKLNYAIKPGMSVEGSYQRSLTANQNSRMLQVTGNDAVVAPGFQWPFALQPETGNTYAHDNIVTYLRWSHVLGERSYYNVQVSRLFTKMRADANGRPWRPETVDSELDPESIITYPATLFLDENGESIQEGAEWVLPGPGLFNNDGIATRFHDHYAEEISIRGIYSRFSADKNNRLDVGLEMKFNDYQWIDIIRPWVGAPIGEGDEATGTGRLGASSDIWQVEPRRGAVFGTQQIRYRGLIANIGARFEYWAPGKYVDDLIDNPLAPIADPVREDYKNSTVKIGDLRYKFRLLPKIRVSFPIRENQVMFFNYGHSSRIPHPTFVYTGLDPFFQDRSFFADLGNPNLDPEVDISYEIGLRNQFSANDVLNVTAFWRDKFDFITTQGIVLEDPTGRQVTRGFRINGDFARVRGVEASYLKRVGGWFQGQVVLAISKATGLASTSNDALSDFLATGDIDNTSETPLAWDTPIDAKANLTFTYDRPRNLLGVPGLNKFRIYTSTTYRSGRRYTPVEFRGNQTNPFTGEQDWRPIYEEVSDPNERFSEIGSAWWWFDLSVSKFVPLGESRLEISLEITNLFNQFNSIIVNPVTGRAYPNVDPNSTDFEALRGNADFDVSTGTRDPRYEDPNSAGLAPFDPARYLPQRHIMLGIAYRF